MIFAVLYCKITQVVLTQCFTLVSFSFINTYNRRILLLDVTYDQRSNYGLKTLRTLCSKKNCATFVFATFGVS